MMQILIIVVLSIALIGVLGNWRGDRRLSPNRVRVRRIRMLIEQLPLKKPMKI